MHERLSYIPDRIILPMVSIVYRITRFKNQLADIVAMLSLVI
jgi:hypothetical protein